MTDCLNRRAFFEQLERMATFGTADGRTLTVAMCDIDFFKRVNDVHGHGAGDQVLKAVAARLRAKVRADDLLCRMGGEEFCIVWNGLPAEYVETRAEDLRRAVGEGAPIEIDGGKALQVTVSIGITRDRADATAIAALLERADKALYEAKRSGRNRVVRWPFEPGADAVVRAGTTAAA